MDKTLIVNAMIFDGSGAAPFSGDVLERMGNMSSPLWMWRTWLVLRDRTIPQPVSSSL